ncbi:MAG: HEAT repeat domain-containing protein [Myxococcota bacterium]|nr:HEAT repeat domain-containing protein [Myxococcota bacterium]
MLHLLLSMALANPDLHNLETDYPEQYERRWNLSPYPNRIGQLHFVGSDLISPDWIPLYLERYHQKGESTDVRRALLYLMHRCDPNLHPSILRSYESESVELRATIVELTLPNRFDASLFNLSSRDSSESVQRELLLAISSNPDLPIKPIRNALQSKDVDVLQAAIRAIHWREAVELIPDLIEQLNHPSTFIQLKALYALSKLDRAEAKRQVKRRRFDQSTDHHVSHLAKGLMQD